MPRLVSCPQAERRRAERIQHEQVLPSPRSRTAVCPWSFCRRPPCRASVFPSHLPSCSELAEHVPADRRSPWSDPVDSTAHGCFQGSADTFSLGRHDCPRGRGPPPRNPCRPSASCSSGQAEPCRPRPSRRRCCRRRRSTAPGGRVRGDAAFRTASSGCGHATFSCSRASYIAAASSVGRDLLPRAVRVPVGHRDRRSRPIVRHVRVSEPGHQADREHPGLLLQFRASLGASARPSARGRWPGRAG